MTLLVGVRCSDGIVLGADGNATLGALGMETASQPSGKKLTILHKKVVFGLSGPIGLAQLLCAQVDQSFTNGELRGRKDEVAQFLRGAFWKLIEPDMRSASVSAHVVGPQAAQESCISSTILAMPVQGQAELFQFNFQASPENASEALPCVALGLGQKIADPFLAFLRKAVWGMKTPTLQDGILAVVWTLRHTIETDARITEPIQIILLRKEKDAKGKEDFIAHELAPQELEEHREAVKDAEDQLAQWRGKMSTKAQANPPPPPPA